MARKKTTFAWVRDEPIPGGIADEATDEADSEEDEDRDASGRLDRVAHRARMEKMKELAIRLAALPPGLRAALPVEEQTLAALDQLAGSDRGPHRRRLVMRARLLLGGEDLARLEAALAGHTPAAARERALLGWRTRILAGDDSVLSAFLAEHSQADRQVLRACIREARGTDEGARRANRSLLRLLRDAVTATDAGDPDSL